MYMADFSLPSVPPQNAVFSGVNTISETSNGKMFASSPLGFQQLLEQKGLVGNNLEQLIPCPPISDSASEITTPQQELALLFLLNPPVTQVVTPTDSLASPTLLQQTVQKDIPIANPMQSNPVSSLSGQTDGISPSLLQDGKPQPTVEVPRSTESFSLQKQVSHETSLSKPVGNNLDTDVLAQAETNAKPLFQNVDDIPLKVGNMPTLDAQASDFSQKLGTELSKTLSHGEQTLFLRLAPAQLGTVTVEMTRSRDGMLQVKIKASSLAATSLLRDCATDLSGILRNSTQNPVYVEVQQTDSSHYPQQQQGGGRQHSHQQHQQQSHEQQQSQDFLEQLRLGLVSLDIEAS